VECVEGVVDKEEEAACVTVAVARGIPEVSQR
jgi:hypothetical protein